MAQRTELAALRVEIRRYCAIFLAVAVPMALLTHFLTDQPMPWWPDTVVMGLPFGVVAALTTWQHRRERGVWRGLKDALRRL